MSVVRERMSSPPPGLRDAVRASLFGFGAVHWMSPRRRRAIQVLLFGAGGVTGAFVAILRAMTGELTLPDGFWWVGLGAIAPIVIALLVYDVFVGLEMLEKRAVEAELELARQIQQRLLPESFPRREGLHIAAFHEAARSVAGDVYDVVELDDGRIGVAIVDVAGKGPAAAILASSIRARLRALASTLHEPLLVASVLNRALMEETEPEHFATLVYGVLDLDARTFRWVNAGHEPPRLSSASGEVRELETSNIPVGMLVDFTPVEDSIELAPGDRLVFLTDGLHDADDRGGILLSGEDVHEVLRRTRPHSVADTVAALIEEADVRQPGDPYDDRTVLALQLD